MRGDEVGAGVLVPGVKAIVAAGDFNRDTHPDLVTANSNYSGTVSILVNNRNGTFQPATTYLATERATSVAPADVNGDGYLDLVVPGSSNGYVSVLPGNGDATFDAPANFTIVNAAGRVAVGDFSADGRQDIAVVSRSNNKVMVLLNSCAVAPTPTITPTGTATSTPTNTATPTNTPVAAEVLVGHLLWAGPPAQPHVTQQLPLTLTLCVGSSPANYGATTDASGFFTIPLSLTPGSYNRWVKGPKYLATAGTANLVNGATRVEMGVQRGGDLDSAHDNRVNAVDYNVFRVAFGTSSTAGDLKNDGLTNALDFQILRNYFGSAGALPNCP